MGLFDHSWTLQAVMEMQKSIGEMSGKLDRLHTDIDRLGTRIEANCDSVDKLKHWQSLVTGGAIVVGVLVAAVWSIITFVPWNRVHFDSAPTAEGSRASSDVRSE
ncbi:hypothetical protein HY78_18935 [Rhizorhabdus wittichii DC-6]|nr:hypothetical protein HY78_18935 [Rhizorhabdus wittichii DC-6]